MSDLISKEYNKIEGSLTLQYRPPNAARLIHINMASDCKNKNIVRTTEQNNIVRDKEVVCEDITDAEVYRFSAEIELDPEICDPANRQIEPIEFSVFGQEHSKMYIKIGTA